MIEPYPYGYKFENSHPAEWILTWWILRYKIETSSPYYNNAIINNNILYSWNGYVLVEKPTIIPWRKWEIFNKVFPTTVFKDQNQMLDIFEMYWLNEEKPPIFNDWNCHWLVLSSLTYKFYPEKLSSFEPDFYNLIWDWWSIRNNIDISKNWNWEWNNYDTPVLRTILEYQLTQKLSVYSDARNNSLVNMTATGILEEIKKHPNNGYLLSFQWR